jgi:Domain of unknown function (DUF4386)
MNSLSSSPRILGAAFLLQAVTSLVSGLILSQVMIVPGNIVDSMANIANDSVLVRASMLGDLITAAGIIFLGVVLFVTLRRQNEGMARVALGLYVLEAAILAASRIAGIFLVGISQQYVTTGHPASLLTMGSQALELMNSGYTLALVPFGLGAILFYYLLYRSRVISRALSLWGLITVPLVFVAALSTLSGYSGLTPLNYPYAPFEFVIGAWILVKGIRKAPEGQQKISNEAEPL